jgi:hypothetical protein
MSKMEFFNFGNSATYHYFTWVRQCGQLNTAALIAKAFDRAATDRDMEVISIGTTDDVQEKLAGLLREILEDRLRDGVPGFLGIEEHGYGEVRPEDPKSLWLPFVAEAADSINHFAIAEALLRDAGNWNPDPPEELFPLPDDPLLDYPTGGSD